MSKLKLTKTELKRQKDALKGYNRYLPTLQLKKQQLQLVIMQINEKKDIKQKEQAAIYERIDAWIAIFSIDLDIQSLLQIDNIDVTNGNIAGVDIPVFNNLNYVNVDYNLFIMPSYIDLIIEKLKEVLRCDAEILVLNEQLRLLEQELRTTSQRVNLFEKIKIPETNFNIRRIQIALGDEQTASVVRGKIAKKKLVKVEE